MKNDFYEEHRLEEFVRPIVDKIERYAELSAAGNTSESEHLKQEILGDMPDCVFTWISFHSRQLPEDAHKVADDPLFAGMSLEEIKKSLTEHASEADKLMKRTHEGIEQDARLKVIYENMMEEAALLSSRAALEGRHLKLVAFDLFHKTIEEKIRPIYIEHWEKILRKQALDEANAHIEVQKRSDRRLLTAGIAATAIGLAGITGLGIYGRSKQPPKQDRTPSTLKAEDTSATQRIEERRSDNRERGR